MCLGAGRDPRAEERLRELAVAAAMSLWADLPNAPYVPKVIARKPMSSSLSRMIFVARRSLAELIKDLPLPAVGPY